MIQHIFKIIWNERKTNSWLIIEYIIIFCIFWFCCDYLYIMLRSYYGDQGYDMSYVYKINMEERPFDVEGNEDVDRYACAITFMERVKHHPDIESISISNAAMPYGPTWMSGYKINSDSLNYSLRQRFVSSGYFDVFKIDVQGRIFDWTDNNSKNDAIISPFKDNKFGVTYNDEMPSVPVSEVHTLHYGQEWDAIKIHHTVIGNVRPIRDSYFEPFMSNIIMPLKREDVNLSHNDIAIRVKPGTEKDFAERFVKDMREQLFIGPYYLASVTSLEDIKVQVDARWGVRDKMNSTYAITLFLVINIFLGILGSFWFRTQSRRNEIGLRIALGSTKRKVQGMIIFETIFLLFISSIVATVICLNLSDPEIIYSLGIPTVPKKEWGIGSEQNIVNYAITFGFLAIVSVVAVWYPARQAAKTQPAEALHDE